MKLWLRLLVLAILLVASPSFAQVFGGPVINGGNSSSISLTTSGTSGAATLSGSVLNIPVYSGSGGSLSLNASTSNISYSITLSPTTTSSGLSVVYSDPNLFDNPSTSTLSDLNLVTSGLMVNGNTAISGTTTISTAQIAAGNATLTNLTATTITGTTGIFPTLDFTNALGTTITATALQITSTGTSVTPSVNDSSTNIATTAFANPLNSTVTNGYTKLPGGTLIEWGQTLTSTTSANTITFPHAFAVAPYSITCNGSFYGDGGHCNPTITASTTTGNVANYASGSYEATIIYWMAIGK